jgi:hypothetical protein
MEQPPPIQQSEPPVAAAPKMSLGARLMNIIAAPGDVFSDLKTAKPAAANWVVPALLLAAAGIVLVFVMFSQPNIIQQIREQQTKALDQQVQAGKLTQAQADQAQAMMEKFSGPSMMKIFGGFFAVVGTFVRVLWWALVLMLLARWFLKTPIAYARALEVAGLGMVVNVLGTFVALLLVANFDRMGAGPHLGLLVKDFSMENRAHLAMGATNPFYFWYIAVVSIGLARLANAPFSRALLPVAVYWVLQEALFIAIPKMGQMAL